MVLFTKDHTYVDKPVTVVNLTPVSFIVGPTRHGITGRIQRDCDPKISVSVNTTVGVPV